MLRCFYSEFLSSVCHQGTWGRGIKGLFQGHTAIKRQGFCPGVSDSKPVFLLLFSCSLLSSGYSCLVNWLKNLKFELRLLRAEFRCKWLLVTPDPGSGQESDYSVSSGSSLKKCVDITILKSMMKSYYRSKNKTCGQREPKDYARFTCPSSLPPQCRPHLRLVPPHTRSQTSRALSSARLNSCMLCPPTSRHCPPVYPLCEKGTLSSKLQWSWVAWEITSFTSHHDALTRPPPPPANFAHESFWLSSAHLPKTTGLQ